MRATNRLFAVALVLGLAGLPAAYAQSPPKDAQPVIAVFALSGPVVETPMGDDFLFGSVGAVPLKDLVARIKKARDDKNVKAVVLLLDGAEINIAQVEELRQAVDLVRSSGKEVYAHADILSMGGYALLSGASKISMVPTGMIWIGGYSAESPYLRGLLDLIGVSPDFLTCGEYKTAAEIFMRKAPSPAAQRMQDWLLDSLFESYLKLVAKGRGANPVVIRQWVDGALYTAETAQKLGIIDKVQQRQEFVAELKAKFGEAVKFDKNYGKKKRAGEIDLSSPLGVFKLWAELLGAGKKPSGKDAVAIVYVEGPIIPGKAEISPFGSMRAAYSTPLRKALGKAADDKSIKAVVLRVHSPGGSAAASEIILDATKRVKAKKPLVVSMGGVAGSGGYYVACGTDTIFADATTITASIGVVGGKFATTAMWNKIGITWNANRRGANAGLLDSDAVFTAAERKKVQDWMNEIYGVFKGHVVAARGNRLKKPIDELAGGRVYTGQQALELGLVDKLGTLDDAIHFAAAQAKIKDYEIRVVPEPKNFMELLLEDLTDSDRDDNRLRVRLPSPAAPRPASILELALPYLKGLDGRRLQSVTSALRRLELVQQERAVLMMPEISVGD